jgi:hypothetical protein
VIRAIATTDKLFTFPTWAVGTTYAANDIVVSAGIYYRSLSAANLGNAPTTATTFWEVWNGPLVATLYDSTIPYYPGELVYNGTHEYVTLIAIAAGATPVDGTDWHEFLTTGAVTTSATPYVKPLTGRTFAFNLPRDFLRIAPYDPKNIICPDDHLIENKQIVSDDAGPIFIRYVRDEEDPTKFDVLFNEGLAARVALEVVEELTQSATKKQQVIQQYNTAIGDARLVNAIEAGTIEQEDDELIVVRR